MKAIIDLKANPDWVEGLQEGQLDAATKMLNGLFNIPITDKNAPHHEVSINGCYTECSEIYIEPFWEDENVLSSDVWIHTGDTSNVGMSYYLDTDKYLLQVEWRDYVIELTAIKREDV